MGVVKIRLRGTKEQLEKLTEDMKLDDCVLSISEFCPDLRKGYSRYGRVYIDYEIPD